jgi:hypothetical protein
MSAAEKRMQKFARYIKRCKKVPRPPMLIPKLNHPNAGIDDMVEVRGSQVVVDVNECTDAEKRFLLEAARKLGFKPRY